MRIVSVALEPPPREVVSVNIQERRKNRLAMRALAVALLFLGCPAVDARHHRARESTGEPGQFDYYLLTLSWSPTYCLTHSEDRAECAGKGYGFILHGLWPQFDSGGYPESCSSDASLSAEAERVGLSLYPSPDLMRHEWQRHGTCSGLDALTYFQTADRALGRVRIPQALETPPAMLTMTSVQVAEKFRAANPGMPEQGLTVACSRGELSEVRVCLTRNLNFRSCGSRVRNACPSMPIEIPSRR
jgi:ribonuclease T2